jgi:hypothetical protein
MIDLRNTASKQSFYREYLMRLGGVVGNTLALLLFVHLVLMIPTLFFLLETNAAKEKNLSLFEAGASGEAFPQEDAARFEQRVTLLEKETKNSLIAGFEKVFESITPGIHLRSIEFTREGEKETLVIQGTAETRDALPLFAETLEKRDDISKATFPVENLVPEEDLNFTVTATHTP